MTKNDKTSKSSSLKVTGVGGIFFKVSNSEESKAWYEKHLGIPAGTYGHTFTWREFENSKSIGRTAWSVSNNYFHEGDEIKNDENENIPNSATAENTKQTYMINYRVANLVELLNELKTNGVKIVGELNEYPYGKFAHILDLDGNKVELWEPVPEDDSSEKIL